MDFLDNKDPFACKIKFTLTFLLDIAGMAILNDSLQTADQNIL